MKYIDQLTERAHEVLDETWGWFMGLNQQEWMLVLAIGAMLGFLCMRGLKSKGHV